MPRKTSEVDIIDGIIFQSFETSEGMHGCFQYAGPCLPVMVRRTSRERKPKFGVKKDITEKKSLQLKIPAATASVPHGEHCLHSVWEPHDEAVYAIPVDSWHTGHKLNCQHFHKLDKKDSIFKSKNPVREQVVCNCTSSRVSVAAAVKTERSNDSLSGPSAEVDQPCSSRDRSSAKLDGHKMETVEDWKDAFHGPRSCKLDIHSQKKKKKRRPRREYDGVKFGSLARRTRGKRRKPGKSSCTVTTPTELSLAMARDGSMHRDSVTPSDGQMHDHAGSVGLGDVSRELVFDLPSSLPEAGLPSASTVKHPKKCLKRKRLSVVESRSNSARRDFPKKKAHKKAKPCEDSKVGSQVPEGSQRLQLSVLLPPDTMDLADAACDGLHSEASTDGLKKNATLQESRPKSRRKVSETAMEAPASQQYSQPQAAGSDPIGPPLPAFQQQKPLKKEAATKTSTKQKSETKKRSSHKPKCKNKMAASGSQLYGNFAVADSPPKHNRTEPEQELFRCSSQSKLSGLHEKCDSSALLAELEKEKSGGPAEQSKPNLLVEPAPLGSDCGVGVMDPLHVVTDLPPTLTPQRQLKQSRKFTSNHMHTGPDLSPPHLSPVCFIPPQTPELACQLLSKMPRKQKQKKQANAGCCPQPPVLDSGLPKVDNAVLSEDLQAKPSPLKLEGRHECIQAEILSHHTTPNVQKKNAQRKVKHQKKMAEKLSSDKSGISADENGISSLYTLLKMEPSELKKLTVDGSSVADMLRSSSTASVKHCTKRFPKRNIRVPARFVQYAEAEGGLVQPLKTATKVKQLSGRAVRPAKQQRLDRAVKSALVTPVTSKPCSTQKRKQKTKVKAKSNMAAPSGNLVIYPRKKVKPPKEVLDTGCESSMPKLDLLPLDANHNTSCVTGPDEKVPLTLSLIDLGPASFSDRLQDVLVSSSTDKATFIHDVAVQVPDIASCPEPVDCAQRSQHYNTLQRDRPITDPCGTSDLLSPPTSTSTVLKIPLDGYLAKPSTGTQTSDIDLYMTEFESH